MLINKSINCDTLEELFKLVKRLEQKKEVVSFDFHGSQSREEKAEGPRREMKRFFVNWVEEEKI